MFIERFFNPLVHETSTKVFYDTNQALAHCIQYYSFIRHPSFKSNQYIKYNGKYLIWNDGSKVDKRKLPRKGKRWGRYYSELHNRCSF